MLAKVSKISTAVMLGTMMLAGAAGNAMAAENKTVLTMVAQQETAWVKNFNPFLQAGLLHTTRHFIYEPLVIFNDMQGGKPVYRLATNYAFSDDLKSVTFDLRDGVKWSDGEAFDADDIIFSFNLVKANKALDERSIWTQIKSVEKLAPNKVKFDLTEVNTKHPLDNFSGEKPNGMSDMLTPLNFTLLSYNVKHYLKHLTRFHSFNDCHASPANEALLRQAV